MPTFKNPYPQLFSISYPIIKYIIQNPSSPIVWKKLIQTCKYFYSKNSIFPVERLRNHVDTKWHLDEKMFKDLNAISSKLWLNNELVVSCQKKNVSEISSLLTKIYKCNLRTLDLWFPQLTWNEYQILTSSGTLKKLNIGKSQIKYSNGELATFENFIKNLWHLKKFNLTCVRNPLLFPPKTMKNIEQILSRFKMLKSLRFYGLPEMFDFFSFLPFIIKNKNVKIFFNHYINDYFSVEYKEICNKFVDALIENPPKKMPFIFYNEMEGVRFEKFKKLYRIDFKIYTVL